MTAERGRYRRDEGGDRTRNEEEALEKKGMMRTTNERRREKTALEVEREGEQKERWGRRGRREAGNEGGGARAR